MSSPFQCFIFINSSFSCLNISKTLAGPRLPNLSKVVTKSPFCISSIGLRDASAMVIIVPAAKHPLDPLI